MVNYTGIFHKEHYDIKISLYPPIGWCISFSGNGNLILFENKIEAVRWVKKHHSNKSILIECWDPL